MYDDDMDIMEREQDLYIEATTDYYLPIDFAFDTQSQSSLKSKESNYTLYH